MRQTFHVATSPIVQAAWERGQEVNVYGVIYSLKDGLVHCLCGPLGKETEIQMEQIEFEESGKSFVVNSEAGAFMKVRLPEAEPAAATHIVCTFAVL